MMPPIALLTTTQDGERTVELNSNRGVKRSHVKFFGSEGVLKAQAEPFSVLLSRALFSAVPPRATPAAAAAAARLARRTRIRFGETPRKPADIAEWNLGSSFTEPVFCFWLKEFKVFMAVGHRRAGRCCGRKLCRHLAGGSHTRWRVVEWNLSSGTGGQC